tara:strand:- start:2918 stop:3184 length:267 start_codon:yes stop_codon:yes gene_type:complete
MSARDFMREFEGMQDDIHSLKKELNELKESKPDAINIKGVVELTELKPSTIRDYCRKSKIPCSKRGKSWWFSRKEVESWLLDRSQTSV